MNRGYFIVLEGPDGSGKSTQARLLAARLEGDGYPCVVTEQPGGTGEGKRIREILLNPDLHIDPKTELFLFLADRAEHVSKVIQPALEKNAIVISSRYFYSTLVYQGMVRAVAPYDFLLQMNLFAVNQVMPDLVFYIDVETKSGLSRAKHSSRKQMSYQQGDRIELEGAEFQEKVRAGYREIAALNSDLFVTIEATGKSREELVNTIYSHVKGKLKDD